VWQRIAIRLVLEILPPAAQPEVQSPAAHDVNTNLNLREQRRVAVRLTRHHGADADPFRLDRECGEQAPSFEAIGGDGVGIVEEVIRDPKAGESRGAGLVRDRKDFLEAEAELRLYLNPEIHRPGL